MVKVLLINPPRTYYAGSVPFDVHLPLGLMYVAAMVRNICDVEIFDCLVFDVKNRSDNAIMYGASSKEICKTIREKKPDVVGISIHSTAQYRNAESVAKIAKEVNPKIVTVFGGPDPSVRFESILENQYCDYCVVGDGEETFYQFILNFSDTSSREKTKGLAYRRDGFVHFEPRTFDSNLDILPFPAYDLVDLKRYFKNKNFYRDRSVIHKNSTSIITSRGCPNGCVFCSVKLHMGQKYRSHSPEYVIKLLRFCKDQYGISNFHFEDDNLTFNKERFEKILDLIIEKKLQIKWDTPNGIRVDSMNYNILEKMKQSGCVHLVLAIESGNQRVLNEVIHKGLDIEYATEIAKFCRQLKIPTNAFYVIGFPGETIKEMEDTVDFALLLFRRYGLSPYLMVATPLYGTDLYDICIKNKFIESEPTPEELCVAIQQWGNPIISTTDFSKEDTKQILLEYGMKRRKELRRRLLRHPQELIAAIWEIAHRLKHEVG